LKPCPFCGSGAERYTAVGKTRDSFYIQCDNYPACAARTFGASDIESAVAQWQRRDETKANELRVASEFIHMAHQSLCPETGELLEGKILPELEQARHWNQGIVLAMAKEKTAKYIEESEKPA
jgi:hypothetical protein